MIFQHPVTLIPMGHGTKATTRIVEESYNSQLTICQGPTNLSAHGLVVGGTQRLPHLELCNFLTGMGSCYNTLWYICGHVIPSIPLHNDHYFRSGKWSLMEGRYLMHVVFNTGLTRQLNLFDTHLNTATTVHDGWLS